MNLNGGQVANQKFLNNIKLA
jgi:hypothetical protein